MKHINKFQTVAAYDEAEKYYPNVSYIEATDEVKYMESDPTLMVVKWDIQSYGSYSITGNQSVFSSITVDGEPQTLSGSGYLNKSFSVGKHEAVYKLVDDTTLGGNALSTVKGDVYLPKTVTTFGQGCFGNGSHVKDVYITDLEAFCKMTTPSGNTSIFNFEDTSRLFLNNVEVTDLVIPDSVTSLGYNHFAHCSSLSSVTFHNSFTTVGSYAFRSCRNLTGALTIPNSVTSIGSSAFAYCSGLTSISIPNSVTFIGNEAFSGCDALETIVVDSGNTKYSSFNGSNGLFEKNLLNKYTLIRGCKNTVLPTDVAYFTGIGSYAFSSCSGLTSITIPDSVTSIGGRAFSDCTDLTEITIPDSVTSIGGYVFYSCSSLNSITSLNTTPPTIGSNAFQNVPATCAIYVPAASVDAYKAANNWSSRADYIQAIP